MDYRTLDLTIISANGLKNGATKSDVYAVVHVYDSDNMSQKFRTPVCKKGGSDPTWNFPMKLTIDHAAILQKRPGIVIEIKAVGMFRDRKLGEVVGQFKVVKRVSTEGNKGQKVGTLTCQVMTPSGKVNGSLTFSYRVGEAYSGNKQQLAVQKGPKPGKRLGGCFLVGALSAAFLDGGGCGCGCGCRCGSGGGDGYGSS